LCHAKGTSFIIIIIIIIVISVAGPTAWNSLSDELFDQTLSTDSFRRLLTTRPFSEYQRI